MKLHLIQVCLLALSVSTLPACDTFKEILGIEDTVQSDIKAGLFEDDDLLNCVAVLTQGLMAKDVQDLVCSGVGVTSLKGLEQFPNLRTMLFNSNRLSSVDLSHFPKLQYLDLSANRLSNIDLTHNPELVEVFLDLNDLDSLDVSNNNKLQALILSGNKLSRLDLAGLTELEELVLDGNQFVGDMRLGALDLRQNSKLINLNLFNNKVTHIDLSKNLTLDHVDIRNNDLVEIDVSTNTNITELRLNNNNLVSIDVSNLKKLDTLVLDNNQISEIDLPILGDSSSLRFVYLRNNQLACDVDECSGLDRFVIPQNPTLIHLDLRENELSVDDINFSDNRFFTELLLSGNTNMTGTFNLPEIDSFNLVELQIDNTDIDSLTFDSYSSYIDIFPRYDIQVISAANTSLDAASKTLLENLHNNRTAHPDFNPDQLSFKYE